MNTPTTPQPTPDAEPGLRPKRYVLGFLFNEDKTRVALIRKQPSRTDQQWQNGKLNGIGGGIEPTDQTPLAAMEREFLEETGHRQQTWREFAVMGGKDWQVHCFAWTCGQLTGLQSMTKETVETHHRVVDIISNPHVIENLPWLIALAVDALEDARPCFATIQYDRTHAPVPAGDGAREALRAAEEQIGKMMHSSDCHWVPPMLRTPLQDVSDNYECTCWKGAVLTLVRAALQPESEGGK